MTEPPSPESERPFLVRKARAGDPDAFERLAAAYRDRMYRWALVRTGDEDDAEDAAQEALVRLHRGLRNFAGSSRFETWLYSVVRSAVADVQRRRARSGGLKDKYAVMGGAPATAEPPPVIEEIETARLSALVRAFLKELPARQREAMDLVDLQGVEQAEAAARLGVSPATLRTHLFRARRATRSRLVDAATDTEETG